MNKMKKKYLCIFFRCIPIRKNTVLFCSFNGQYNDNPKYISDKLHEMYPTIKVVWCKSSKSNEDFPKYAEIVEEDSVAFYKYVNSAQVIVDNQMGIRAVRVSKKFRIKKLLKILYSKKRKKQYNISTWHGTPLKNIGMDELSCQGKEEIFITNSDYIVAGCQHTKNALLTASRDVLSVKMYGTPRNDLLIEHNVNIEELKKKFNIPLNSKVVLYAPTFRNDINNSGVNQMHELQFDKILEQLNLKFSSEWCFVFRIHQAVLDKIDIGKIVNKYKKYKIVNGNLGDDMAEYLLCADVLITDYSGSMFDFALTKKPCFLYAPDRKHYEEQERGFYMDYEKLPFSYAYTSNELIEKIRKFDEVLYKQNVEKFLHDIGNIEDGHATERIVDDIRYFMETGVKR